MLIPKRSREEIFNYLFKEGVLVAKKDFNSKHPNMDVPNLHVVQLMRSFTSKGFVKEQYAWRHYYWYLTNEGIEFLRDYLNLKAEIVPATLKKREPKRDMGSRPAGDDRPPRLGRGGGFGGGGRDDYRKNQPAPDAYAPQFRGVSS
eukprot:TRINITY_DN8710_c0_g1_i1.p1 TRINITY_DN8710_c0_g1~~TRINITY_DN8710_c0_g1_i1.p1  ORF type:complete len:146 (+),score=34.39 TRINITY_DN8710_c0_g1_i1:56-493(+)